MERVDWPLTENHKWDIILKSETPTEEIQFEQSSQSEEVANVPTKEIQSEQFSQSEEVEQSSQSEEVALVPTDGIQSE